MEETETHPTKSLETNYNEEELFDDVYINKDSFDQEELLNMLGKISFNLEYNKDSVINAYIKWLINPQTIIFF